jgi:thioredoxin reductase
MAGTYDVVVVGGGAAGLSAALTLARARRSVLVVDAGRTRNATAGHVHGYLGREGATPAALLASGRAEVCGYGGVVREGTVVSVTPLAGTDEPTCFRVGLADGSDVTTRRVVLTTGLEDQLPDVAGLAERWGRDVLHCPYCHGWEVRDRPLALVGTAASAVAEALLFRQWSDDVTLVLHDCPSLDPDEAEQLAARDVRVVAGPAAAVEVDDDRITGLRLVDGGRVDCVAVVVQPVVTARPDVLRSLGLHRQEQRDDDGLVDRHLEVDAAGATAVPGVWAAGNLVDPGAQVVTAAAAGLHVAAAVNVDLVEEDVRVAVTRRRAQAAGAGGIVGSAAAP